MAKILTKSSSATVVVLMKFKDGTVEKALYKINNQDKIKHFASLISGAEQSKTRSDEDFYDALDEAEEIKYDI